MSDPSTKGNNERIRDNQRRSRARRKEYLQELETKFRNCEQLGVEASAKMQAAARLVVEENKRLRLLLRQKGVSDAEIDAFTLRDADSASEPSPVASLQTMLQTRIPCSGESKCGVANGARGPPILPLKITSPVQDSSCRPKCGAYLPDLKEPPLLTNIEVVSPQSSYSNGSVPITPTTMTQPITTPTVTQFNHIPPPGSYPMVSMPQGPYSQPGAMYNGVPPPMRQNFVAVSGEQPYDNTSSCAYAVSLVRDIRPDAGPELEAQMCANYNGDCKVDNAVVFEMIDKYSQPNMGI